MSNELKPCPFCGKQPMILKVGAYSRKHLIKCTGCKVAPEIVCKDKLTTVSAWNTRTESTELEQLRKELEGAKDDCRFLAWVSEQHHLGEDAIDRMTELLAKLNKQSGE